MSVNPPETSNHHAIPDTGTTGNHAMCDVPLLNKRQIKNGPTVLLPDDITMKATHVEILSMLSVPNKDAMSCTFPAANKSLLSTSAVCDEGGEARLMNK